MILISEERAAWLAGLKPGDAVLAYDRHLLPSVREVRFVDSSRIFYGADDDYPDWVWREHGHALLDTYSHRWIERPPTAPASDSRIGEMQAS